MYNCLTPLSLSYYLIQKSMTEKPTHHRELSVATAEAMKNMEGVTLPDEWQDDEFSQQKLAGVDSTQEEESFFRRKVPSTVTFLINILYHFRSAQTFWNTYH